MRQSRITPKQTAFKPRHKLVAQKLKATDAETVWVDREGVAYRMADLTDAHLVSVVSMIDRSLRHFRGEADKRGISLTADKGFREYTDKMLTFLMELAVRGIPYSDVPKLGDPT
jgi:hypothetical protein